MPRGFLVKRQKHCVAASYRIRRYSDDDRSDSSSDHDVPEHYTNFGSPDSGFSSPLRFTYRDTDIPLTEVDLSPRCSLASSPLSLKTSAALHSYATPFYFSSLDRLTVSPGSTPIRSQIKFVPENLVVPASPSKKRVHFDNASERKIKTPKKCKAARKLNFDEDKSSPVSGTIIKDVDSGDECTVTHRGDIDSSLNVVEVTEEAKAEIAKIINKIGEYVCQLCKEQYSDAFSLAQHKCSRIVHVEYRCPECDKVFNCPANLASHRRWHKPRPNGQSKPTTPRLLPANPIKILEEKDFLKMETIEPEPMEEGEIDKDSDNDSLASDSARNTPSPSSEDPGGALSEEGQFECEQCGKKFRRQAYLRKHMQNHGDDQLFPCLYCGKIFRSMTARAKHALQHTLGPKDFMCNVCGNGFPNKGALEKHSRIHSTEVFSCKYCSSTFYSSPGLTRHINKCHPSENRQVILLQLPRPCP